MAFGATSPQPGAPEKAQIENKRSSIDYGEGSYGVAPADLPLERKAWAPAHPGNRSSHSSPAPRRVPLNSHMKMQTGGEVLWMGGTMARQHRWQGCCSVLRTRPGVTRSRERGLAGGADESRSTPCAASYNRWSPDHGSWRKRKRGTKGRWQTGGKLDGWVEPWRGNTGGAAKLYG